MILIYKVEIGTDDTIPGNRRDVYVFAKEARQAIEKAIDITGYKKPFIICVEQILDNYAAVDLIKSLNTVKPSAIEDH